MVNLTRIYTRTGDDGTTALGDFSRVRKTDSRLEAYRTNARKVPAVAGRVIPEPIFHIDEYKQAVLEGLYHEMAPYDRQGILRYEWVNARGCIPRFERNTL